MNRRGFFARTVGALIAAIQRRMAKRSNAFDGMTTSVRPIYNQCSADLLPDWDQE